LVVVLLIELLELLPSGLLDGAEHLFVQGLNRAQASIGVYQAGIDMNFAPFDQAGLHTLLHHPAKERHKDLFAPALTGLAQHAVIRDLIV
jgi:hypothetical protein